MATARVQDALTRDECVELLASSSMGRLALSAAALPIVVPAPYALNGGGVVIRLADVPSIDAAIVDAVVAFSVDDIDPASHQGRTVLVTGLAHAVDRHGEPCVAIPVEVVSGQRVRWPAP